MTEELKKPEQSNNSQTINIQAENQSNGMGVAGFILALLGLFLGWIPFVGWIIGFLGLLFSFIGVFKSPKGLAIAGLIISIISLFFLIFFYGVLIAAS
tara:strand:+ start:164 stop:457 length:294 start_codon:yes stop_codon:yes gene_type:complete